MEKIREKFLIECAACEGTGIFQKHNFAFGQDYYTDEPCGCNDGKELNWDLFYKEQEEAKETINELEASIVGLNQVMRESLDVNNNHVINALRQIVKYEKMIEEREGYLEQLAEID